MPDNLHEYKASEEEQVYRTIDTLHRDISALYDSYKKWKRKYAGLFDRAEQYFTVTRFYEKLLSNLKDSKKGMKNQFLPRTAKGLGTNTQELAKMSAVEQLDYVYKHLKGYTGKIHNIYDAYMTVFLPIAVGKDDDFILGIKDSNEELAKGLTYGAVFERNSYLDYNKDEKIEKWEAAQRVIDTRDKYKKIK